MTYRAILPGALLAVMLTAGATLALVLALGVRGDGPLSVLLGGSDGAVRLPERVTLAPVGGAGLQPGPVARPASRAATAVLPATAGAPAASQRGGAGLRGDTQARRPARRSPARAPSRSAPSAPSTPAPATQAPLTSNTAPQPAADAAPPAVKVRGRGRDTSTPGVPKQRVQSVRPPASPVATPGPSAEPAPRTDAPPAELRPYQSPAPDTSTGSDSGVLTRVPPGPPQ